MSVEWEDRPAPDSGSGKTHDEEEKMKRTVISMLALLALASLMLAAQPVQAAEQLVAVSFDSATVYFDVLMENDGVVMSVSGPCRFNFEQNYKSGDQPTFRIYDPKGHPLLDGSYTWQIRLVPALDSQTRKDLIAARKKGDTSLALELKLAGILPDKPLVAAGFFSIEKGKIVDDGVPEKDFAQGEGEKPALNAPAIPGDGAPLVGLKDFVINDDLIVDGSACIGFDCVNGESFGFDTIRLKENNLRIKFDDTSVAASFPRNDWQLTANDSANGGASKFSIDDISGGRTPFTVEANAPSHSLYVDDGGRIGNGTSTPSVEIHTVDGDTPTLRLQQDGSSGFAPQTWDVAGNETNFFIRDVTNGSALPFRIRPGAPTNSIFIDVDGDVGIGTSSPQDTGGNDVSLHVRETNGTAKIFVEEDSATEAARNLLDLENNGTVQMRFQDDSANGDTWQLSNFDGGFNFSKQGSGAIEFEIQDDGDVMIPVGSSYLGSDRNRKSHIVPVDPADVLARLTQLPIATWSWQKDHGKELHVGPMAQDFRAAFGLGQDDVTIVPMDMTGVAIAGVQGLYQLLEEKDQRIADLEARLAAIEARLP
jgi:hypothetical protein